MKYKKAWLESVIDQNQAVKYLFFWGHQPTKDGSISASCLSQWWQDHAFVEGGITYLTAEHYMMAGKARLFGDQEILRQILDARNPAEAKNLGRRVSNFDQQVWQAEGPKIVVAANVLKFSQHPELKEFLLNTGSRILVEASPMDRIWGIGLAKNDPKAINPLAWQGKNLLGFCLMEARDRLKGQS